MSCDEHQCRARPSTHLQALIFHDLKSKQMHMGIAVGVLHFACLWQCFKLNAKVCY